MLAIYHGNDPAAVRQAVKKDWSAAVNPEVEVLTISADTFVSGQLAEAVGGDSLFATQCWYILDTPSAHSDFIAEFDHYVADMAAASHQFVVIEVKLTAAQKKQYTKYTDQIIDCTIATPQRPTAFGLVDHLCRRNKRQLWLELQTALTNGLSPEVIIGTLWWQLKTIRLAACTASAEEAGLKPYPYQKASAALRVFSLAEVERLSRDLLTVYHDGHSGKQDILLALEAWVLRV